MENEIRTIYGNDIGITTVQAILETVEEFIGGINSFLSSIAIVSLVVGAVGIITTLYTSVVERTREIGTLKALGASNLTILGLFVMEAGTNRYYRSFSGTGGMHRNGIYACEFKSWR